MANPAIEHHFAIDAKQLEFRAPGALDEYVEFLKSIDIGVAPLLPSEFNHCRHDVKFLNTLPPTLYPFARVYRFIETLLTMVKQGSSLTQNQI